jgi:hypothetical protein
VLHQKTGERHSESDNCLLELKMNTKRVRGYKYDKERQKEELIFKTYEYDLPFNYPNVTVWRKDYDGAEFHGVELITQNASSPKAKLTGVEPGQWIRIRTTVRVMAEASTAEFRLDVANMEPDETLCIADAFAAVVPEEWNENGDIPADAENLILNPTFSGRQLPPTDWKIDGATDSISQMPIDAQGHTGLSLKKAQISIYTPIPVKVGQRLVFELWVKSTNPYPKTVLLHPKWKNDKELYLCDNSGDCIIIEEEQPIVRVAVIGSACTPPGYVMLEAQPSEEFYHRGDFIRCTAPVRFKQSNLWGMHLRYDQWSGPGGIDFGYEDIPKAMIERYPGLSQESVKAHYQAYPLAGMSCAVFEIPKSQKVIIMGGSETTGWLTDNAGCDDHYSFRTIRTTVAASR